MKGIGYDLFQQEKQKMTEQAGTHTQKKTMTPPPPPHFSIHTLLLNLLGCSCQLEKRV